MSTDGEDKAEHGRDLRTVSVTEAQGQFASVVQRARTGEHVRITRYNRPVAVLVSVEEYESLRSLSPKGLSELEAEFDRQTARMQTPAHRAGVDALFRMTPKELGEAAAREGTDPT